MSSLSSCDNEGLLYFNHIPKTAGTSLRNSLERLFPCSGHNDYWFTDKYLSDTKSNLEGYRLLSGHFGMIPPLVSARRHRMLVFLRDPVERVFSHYLHIKSDENSPWQFITEKLGFEDFLFSPVAEGELLNFQARHLGFSSVNDYFEIKDRMLDRDFVVKKCRNIAMLKEAKANFDRSWFVGLSSKFDSSMRRLSHQLGVPLDGEARLNVARIQSVMPELSKSARSRLEWLTEFDQELYQLAQSRYETDDEEDASITSPDLTYFKTHIDFTSGFVGGGWHPVEIRHGAGYCWSYSNAPWVAFIASWRGNSTLTARIATWVPEDLASTVVTVNGENIRFDLAMGDTAGDGNFMYLYATIPADLVGPSGMLKVHFTAPRTIQPKVDFGENDERTLGIYASWIRLLPENGYRSL